MRDEFCLDTKVADSDDVGLEMLQFVPLDPPSVKAMIVLTGCVANQRIEEPLGD